MDKVDKINIDEWLGNSQLGSDIVCKKYLQDGEDFNDWAERISNGNKELKQLFIDQKFIPAGRILSNRGLDNKGIKSTLSNCYVLSTNDSIEDIYKTCSDMARTYSYGGGVGIDISPLRPAGAIVHNSARSTSGAVSFMKTFDVVTGTIGQCVEGSQLVLTEHGPTEIKDLVVGDSVYTKNGFVKVINKINQGIRKVKKVTNDLGNEIIVTEDHPMLTCSLDEPIIERKLSEMHIGDDIIVMSGCNTSKNYINLDIDVVLPTRKIINQTGFCGEMVHNKYMECKLPDTIDEKLGYLLGYMSGDGYTSKNNVSVTCNSNDVEIIDKISGYCYDVFGVIPTVKDYKTWKSLCFGGKIIKLFLEKNGINKTKTEYLRIPKKIFESPASVQCAYLSGLMDADGSVIKGKKYYKITTVNESFAHDIQLLMNINGIITKKHVYNPNHTNWKAKYDITVVGCVNKRNLFEKLSESVKVNNNIITNKRDNYLSVYTGKTVGHIRDKKHNYIPFDGYMSVECIKKLIDCGEYSGEILYKSKVKSIDDYIESEVFDITLETENMFWCNGYYIHNCGRRGALMISIDVNHPDLPEFINIKANTDQITNANISIRVNNSFMNAVKNNEDYVLHWPCDMTLSDSEKNSLEYDKLTEVETMCGPVYLKKVKAKELFMQIAKNNWDFGEPGVLYWDRIANYHMMSANKAFKYAGVNPCVSGDTLILTDKGYQRIDSLIGKKVNVWNGYQWSETEPRVTGHNQEMLLVTMSNGVQINCTKYHKFVLKNGERVEAKDLKPGDKLIQCEFPIININGESIDEKVAYTLGFFSGDGYIKRDDEPIIYLYKDKKNCLPHLISGGIVREDKNEDRIAVTYTNKSELFSHSKLFVPNTNWDVVSRLNWLAGLIDSDGCKNDNSGGVSISSVEKDFLKNIQLMLTTLGVKSSVNVMHKAGKRALPANNGTNETKEYNCKESYRLVISGSQVQKLFSLGLVLHRVKIDVKPNRSANRFITIKEVQDNGICETVYCFNEPINHTGIFNGCITGQCAEEPLPDGGACLLGSMNLYKYVVNGKFDWGMFDKDVRIATIGLNEIQVEGTDLHPLKIQQETAKKYKQIGLGIFDLAGALIKLGIKYGSDEAKEFADKVTHAMLISAFEQSCDLNKDNIVYDNLFESEFYKERIEPFIKEQYKGKYPLNSQLLTIAPTGSISTMLNAGAGGGEPIFRIAYTRDTKSIGEKTYHVCSNAVLDYFNGDNYAVDESVLPDYFVTADKISPKDRIEMQAALQKNIDASISSTINLPKSSTVEDVYNIYMYAWERGLKGVTVFRDGCKRAAILNTIGSSNSNAEFNTVDAPKRPKVLDADYYQVKVHGENFIIIVGLLNGKPYELFALPCDNCQKVKNHKGKITRVKKCEYKFESELLEIDNIAIDLEKDNDIFEEIDKISEIVSEGKKLTKLDTENIRDCVYHIKDWSEKREYRNVALHVSGNLRTGMRLEDIIKLEEKCNDSITSFNKAISRVLSKYLATEETDEVCPECGSKLVNEGGCVHCPNCGWSRCG